ncbi:ABC transporter ATP-binding protein [Methanomassiliicoccales archaeon RumEn M1]|jgi:methyl coenzyme M reductase system subunit A2|nr:ABC transporter ATP-binding protein [Methanomassiliicoccales archaeon RumEn M1]
MAEGAEAFIVVNNVSKKFGGSYVLRDISATIHTGEILGLIGRSGAGKSVLINMLRGTEEYRPDAGSVIYRFNSCDACGWLDLPFPGRECGKCGAAMEIKEVDFWALDADDPMRSAIRRHIAIMLQRTFALFGDMSVLENIFEALGPDMGDKLKVERALELLKKVRLEHRVMHIARDLSGGEKQRCVLARQLARDPLLFLADEPTGTLDPQTADMVHDTLVRAVKESGMAMVVTSHWPKAINTMADRAIWLESGEMMKIGDPEDVTSEFMVGFEPNLDEKVDVGQPLVKIEDAKRYFYSYARGVVKAVDGVTFDVKEKEIIGLVGLSGAGKTTLSRLIAGLNVVSDGKVSVRVGDDWVDMSVPGPEGRGRATQYIGILHQEFTLYPFDTVLRNLTVCIGINLPAELAKMKAIQTLMAVGFTRQQVDRLLYAYPDTLSVGEKQRIALAQVLIREPRLVILDEPTGTMDPITKLSVAKSVLSARKELGETFIIVSHDMDFVMNCCDRAVFMKDGKVVSLGKPDEIVAHLTEGEARIMLEGGAEE